MPVPGTTPPAGPLGRSARYLRTVAELARHPYEGTENLYRTYGPVWRLGSGKLAYVYLLGPEANRFVFANSQLFRWREAFEQLIPVDGETALIVSDGEEHHRRRRLVAPAFHHREVDGYVEIMRTFADEAIDAWRPGQTLDAYEELRSVIRRITVRVLFGERLAADQRTLGRQLQLVLDLINQSPLVQQVQRWGLPSYRRATAARAEVARRVLTEVEHRRAHPDEDQHDVLTLLTAARDEDGARLSDVEIIDQVVSLIAAGYDSTSAAIAWAVHAMARDPKVWERARAETEEVLGSRPVTAADLPKLPYLDHVVNETLRLYPAAPFNARKAAESFTFEGHRIPRGALIVLSAYVTHRLPEVWRDPESFLPERWDPAEPGYRKAGPHEFLPFGGGPHRCIGATFASVEMKVLLAQLVRRVSLQLPRVPAKPVGFTVMRPERLPVRVRSRD
ncbi:cytochrome P450 [Streptomyces sp. AJS327]|uniref:cytochrome P450 n=1 Tax=Streptomyces sp. AJS327 TaxID=2545265 RepID=UPI0015DD90C8|nr:cytochrome P450 [Streptomyces sp. AJS327]MBA0051966.1 cytochrome P450 [Streptomyces sp. AJS327]